MSYKFRFWTERLSPPRIIYRHLHPECDNVELVLCDRTRVRLPVHKTLLRHQRAQQGPGVPLPGPVQGTQLQRSRLHGEDQTGRVSPSAQQLFHLVHAGLLGKRCASRKQKAHLHSQSQIQRTVSRFWDSFNQFSSVCQRGRRQCFIG